MMKYRKNRAMTFVELMVALTISIMLMGATYFIAKAQFGTTQSQQEVMDAIRTARMALSYLKNDIAAAGFLASPDLMTDNSGKPVDQDICTLPTFSSGMRPSAIQLVLPNNSPYQGNYNKNIHPMSITLLGAYPTHLTFRTDHISGTNIYLQSGAGTNLPSPQSDKYAGFKPIFNQIFSTNHILRLINQNNRMLFFRITGRDYTSATITVNQAVPAASGNCGVAGFGRALAVNVVSFIRYKLLKQKQDLNRPSLQNHFVLVREELNPFNGWGPVTSTIIPIADYAVDLQFYDFIIDMDMTGKAPDLSPFKWHPNPYTLPESVLMQGAAPPVAVYMGTDTSKSTTYGVKDLRFMTIKLSIRTRDEDHSIPYKQSSGSSGPGKHKPIDYFDADPGTQGLARVVSLLAKVELTSLAGRNMK